MRESTKHYLNVAAFGAFALLAFSLGFLDVEKSTAVMIGGAAAILLAVGVHLLSKH